MTSRLEEMQAFFATAICQPVGIDAQPDGRTLTSGIISGNSRLSPVAQLEVYREQFWMRHVDALAEDFVTIHHLLGHERFTTLVERYLAAHPPLDFSLRDLGARMPGFVATHSAYRDDPLLVECARLEWAFVEAFDAADAAPLDPSSFASMPEEAWPAARLTFHPSMQRVALTHSTHDYRAAVRKGEAPPRPPRAPVSVVVYRGVDSLQYIDVEPLAFELLERLAQGEALGAACEAVAAAAGEGGEAELEEKVGRWFQHWAAFGWVTAVSA